MDGNKQRTMLELFSEYSAVRAQAPQDSWLEVENARNVKNFGLFEAMIREAFDGVKLVVCGHHLMFMREGEKMPYEVASADTLMFDHRVAKKIWGGNYLEVLKRLAATPPSERDALLQALYDERER